MLMLHRNEECWEKLWKKATQLASTVGLTIEKPRAARAQIHRGNVGSVNQSSSTYYRLNVFYPFIDHVVTELETRFQIIMKDLLPSSI